MAKLGEVCTIVSGSTPKTSVTSYWDGNIKWITPAELNEDTFYIMDSVRHITEEGKEKTGLSYLPTGTVILSSRAPIGKTAIAGCEMCCNQGFKNLICSDAIYNEYLYFFLKSKTDYLNSLGRGATFKEISKSIVENIEIPLPEVNQQKEIAEKFKKLEQLISLRKQQLAKLDELVKARFVEMFGDEQAFNKEPLSQNVEEMFIGPFGSSLKNENFVSKENGYCMVYEQKHAIRKTMDVETRYIDKPKYEELKRFSIHGGDIIVSCRGTIGETYIVPLNAPLGIMHPSIMKIRVKDSIYNRVFFDFLLQEKLKQHEAQANGSGVKMAVTASALGKEEFIVPSIPFQNQFAAFVERVDQQKQTVQQSLEKLELVKKALMQEYFG